MTKFDALFDFAGDFLSDISGTANNNMIGMLMPVIQQGLKMLAKKSAEMPEETVINAQERLASVLTVIAADLSTPLVTPEEFKAHLDQLKKAFVAA